MNKKIYKIKISVDPLLGKGGVVHWKRFTVPSCVAVAFSDACLAESATETDHYHSHYLKQTLAIERNKKGLNPYILMNFKQTHYFQDWARRHEQIEIDNKRASYKANGWLSIE